MIEIDLSESTDEEAGKTPEASETNKKRKASASPSISPAPIPKKTIPSKLQNGTSAKLSANEGSAKKRRLPPRNSTERDTNSNSSSASNKSISPVASTSKLAPPSNKAQHKPPADTSGSVLHVRSARPSPVPPAVTTAKKRHGTAFQTPPVENRYKLSAEALERTKFKGRVFRDRVQFPAVPSLAERLDPNGAAASQEPESSINQAASRQTSGGDASAEDAIAVETPESNAVGEVVDKEVVNVVTKKLGEPRTVTKMVKKRNHKIDLSRWSQTGPEREGEFDTHLQRHMNSAKADRKDKMRAVVFEGMMEERALVEEPFAPPITVAPHPEEAAPEFSFIYTSRVVYKNGVNTIQAMGCTCKDGCRADDSCACYKRQSEENATYGHPPGFAYDKRGLLKFKYDEPIAVRECNDMCGCPPECQNRVIGNGRAVPIELYRTANCGWGARLGPLQRSDPDKQGKIKAGTFIGVYSGELVSTNEARRRDQLYNTINLSYLFDLDFQSIGKNQELKKFDEDGIAFISGSKDTVSSFIQGPPGHTTITQGDDPNRGKIPLGDGSTEKGKQPQALNTFQAFHSVDAYHYGNHTRFINHSCVSCRRYAEHGTTSDPYLCNSKQIASFAVAHISTDVNEGDPTKPFLAIFTVKTIRAGEPLTINYSGEIDLDEADEEDEALNMPRSVAVARGKAKGKKAKPPPKVYKDEKRNCFCGAPRCIGRMFRDLTDSEDEIESSTGTALVKPSVVAPLAALSAPISLPPPVIIANGPVTMQ